jgi:hypothetical protein
VPDTVHGCHVTDCLYTSSTLANAGRPDDDEGAADGVPGLNSEVGPGSDTEADAVGGDALGTSVGDAGAEDGVAVTTVVCVGVSCGAGVIEHAASMPTKRNARMRERRIDRS